MRKLITVAACAVLIVLAGLTPAAAQEDDGPTALPVEAYLCNYVDGAGPADLDAWSADWNAWADTQEDLSDYTAVTMVPFYFSGNQEFDFIWMGISPSGAALGRAQEAWLSTGGELAASLAEVINCSAHLNFASLMFKSPGDGPIPDSIVASFSDCSLAEGKSFDDAAPALGAWAEYKNEQGSESGIWVFFPAYGGGGEEFDFKYVTSHKDLEAQGTDWDEFAAGGHEKASELFAGVMSCDSGRVYKVTTRRRAATPE